MKILNKIYLLFAFIAVLCVNANSQSLSDVQKKELRDKFDKHIKTVSSVSADNVDMIQVYNYQIEKAKQFLADNERYNTDKDIYSKCLELKAVVKQNGELLEFVTPRASYMYYTKAVSYLSDNKISQAVEYLNKAVALKKDNVMAQYELSKISLDSGNIIQATDRLAEVLSLIDSDGEERQLCLNLMAYSYDKNLLKSLSLINRASMRMLMIF